MARMGRFTTDPERACYAIWTMWAVSWFLAAAWPSRPHSRASIAEQLPYRILTIAGLVLLFAVRTNQYHEPLRLWTLPTSAGWMMVLLCAMGFGFTWWARLHLGQLWVRVCDSQSGSPDFRYGALWYRAPSDLYRDYRGGGRQRTVIAFAGALLAAFGFWVKARLEEGFLSEQPGAEAYGSYRRRLPMLVPFGPA